MKTLNRIPLNSLRAVEAVARLGSLRRAADELGVTIGAVSQQVLLAERQLGLTLFDRQPSGMVATPRGAEVVTLLAEGFAQLAAAVTRARRGDDALTVSVAPVFAARWLIWRLPRFSAAHPDIRVRLDARLQLVEPGRDDVDFCLRNGPGPYPGVRAERIFPQVIFPVCAPALADRLRDAADLARVPVIRETEANYGWDEWLGPEGRTEVCPAAGPEFSDAMLCLDAAMTGAGVFLSFETLAADALANGRLVAPFAGRHATRNSYWFVTEAQGRPRRAVAAFAGWLRAEIAAAGLGRTAARPVSAP